MALVPADAPWGALDNLACPWQLPRLRCVRVGMESSYDRTGGNDDGFSGKYSFIRKEGDTLVIAELQGPGVVQRFWTPTPTDDPIEFYFDGEESPRVRCPFRDLFGGKVRGFPEPLVGRGVGGFTSYVPLPYRRSLKIAYRGPLVQFFQIGHATLPAGSAIESFNPDWQAAMPEQAAAAASLFRLTAQADPWRRFVPAGARISTERKRGRLEPGGRLALLDAGTGGRIVGIKLRPARELAGKDRAVLFVAAWDGMAAVRCPVGDFFGASFGEPAMRSAVMGTEGDTNYAYLPMPWGKAAMVELVSERRSGLPVDVESEIITADAPLLPGEGRFYALWRRENPCAIGKPYTFLHAEGHGHVVGVALQAQGPEPGSTPFFEGDDQATIDGVLSMHGTGSEDFFNGGWYDVPGRWDTRRSLALWGCLGYGKHLGRSAGFRFMLPDPVVFHESIHYAIEHAPERNDLATDYTSVTYLYADRPPESAGRLDELELRTVADPARIVFALGWNVKLRSFPVRNATLEKLEVPVGEKKQRVLRMAAVGEDILGSPCLELECDVPVEGDYRLLLDAVAGPEHGKVQLIRDETPIGPAWDFNAPGGRELRGVELGSLHLHEGRSSVMLRLTPAAPDQSRFVMELVRLSLIR